MNFNPYTLTSGAAGQPENATKKYMSRDKGRFRMPQPRVKLLQNCLEIDDTTKEDGTFQSSLKPAD